MAMLVYQRVHVAFQLNIIYVNVAYHFLINDMLLYLATLHMMGNLSCGLVDPWNFPSLAGSGVDDVSNGDFGIEVFIVTTLPETNIAPENRPLEKEIPIGNHHF